MSTPRNDRATQMFFLAMLWLCTALLSGYQFPLSRIFEPDVQIFPLICFLLFFGALGSLMTRIYGSGYTLRILVMVFIFASLGLVGRYLFSADLSIFTAKNVIEYLITVTLYTTIAYNWFPKGKQA